MFSNLLDVIMPQHNEVKFKTNAFITWLIPRCIEMPWTHGLWCKPTEKKESQRKFKQKTENSGY